METIEDTRENLRDFDSQDSYEGSNKEPSANIPIGTLLGTRYEILEVLGVGGFGAVYKSKDLVLDEIVAIKVLDEKYSADKNTLDRFKREIKLARKITHKNVVRIFDIDEVEKHSIISMEYFQGQSLKDLLKKEGKLKPARAIDIGIQICSALHVAHKNGVIHRDIKPQNILINNDDFVKIVDFGIARSSIDFSTSGSSKEITKTGVIVGTPEYLSPEQVDGTKTLDHKTDIYSVGIVLYEMFTGEIPFKGNTAIATILKRINEDPILLTKINPKLPPELDRIIVKTAMARNVENRYKSILELSEDLSYLKETPSREEDDKLVVSIKTSRLPSRIQKQIEELEKEGTRLFLAKYYKESADIWEKILELDPRDEKAAHFYKKASLKRDDVTTKFKEAQFNFRKGSYRACIKLLEEVLSLFKYHTEALNLLEKARKQLNKKGERVSGVYAQRQGFKSGTGLGFKLTFVALFILTTAFLYLQYAMKSTSADGANSTKNEISRKPQENPPLNPPVIKRTVHSKKADVKKRKESPPPSAYQEDSQGYLRVTDPKLNGQTIYGTKIYVDGNFHNYAPQAKIKLSSGKHTILITYEINNITYNKEQSINIKPGERTVLTPYFSDSNKAN
jgi:serine/threonine protein kinase